ALRAELDGGVDTFLTESGLSQDADLELVGDYLFEELAAEGTNERGFVSGSGVRHLLDRFHRALGIARETTRKSFEEDLREGDAAWAGAWQTVSIWSASGRRSNSPR